MKRSACVKGNRHFDRCQFAGLEAPLAQSKYGFLVQTVRASGFYYRDISDLAGTKINVHSKPPSPANARPMIFGGVPRVDSVNDIALRCGSFDLLGHKEGCARHASQDADCQSCSHR